MKKALVLCLFLAGCVPVVKIPVPVPCPQPPAIERPHLPVADLRPGDSPAAVQKAQVLTIRILRDYAVELETIVEGYR